MPHSTFKRTGTLLKLELRHDWLKIELWLTGLVGLMAAAAAKFGGIYGTQKEMATIATTLKTPAMVSLLGPFTAKPPYTTALIYGSEMMVFMGLFTVMMNIHLAIHATRSQEESGLTELMLARSVGRQAPLLAAMLELIMVNGLGGVLEALGLQAAQMPGATPAGNWLFGLGLAAFGLMFGSFSLLFAQLASTSRGALMLSYGFLGLVFIARMGTDVQNPDLTWWTIFGWIEKMELYTNNNWWPVLLMLVGALIGGTLAVVLATRRDLGAGLMTPKPGRKRASVFLQGPLSLLARVNRTSTIVWLLGLALLGASYGSIFGTVGDLVKTNPVLGQLLGSAAVAAANRAVVLAMANKLAVIFVVVATIPAVMMILGLNRDEQKGLLTLMQAKPIGRMRLALTTTGYGLVVGSAAFIAAIWGMAAAGQQSMTITITLARFMRSFVGYWPALLVVCGLAMLLAGLLPKWQTVIWIVPIYGVISLYLGPLMDLPKWALKLSPYGWVNKVPASAINWGTFGWMTALGVVLLGLGLWAYRRRDLLMN